MKLQIHLQVRNWWRNRQVIRKFILEMRNEHSELSSPVANVIQPQNIMTQEFQHPRDAFTYYRGPQVSNVHLLCNVRAGKVDDDFSLLYNRCWYFSGFHQGCEQSLSEFPLKKNVDESGTCNLQLFDQRRWRYFGHDCVGDVKWREFYTWKERILNSKTTLLLLL